MTLTPFWNNYINLEPGIGEIALRLACAMLVGIIIGTEREYTHRPAGLRTHILVALGACVVSITGEMLFTHYQSLGAMPDPARLSAQVITGVGFLGAGTIMKEGASVKGLTTAASVWAVACLGIAAGFGYYALAIVGMLFILITLTIFEAVQHKFMNPRASEDQYTLETTDISASLTLINSASKENQATVYDLMAEKTEDGHRITFRAFFIGRRSGKHRQRFFETLAAAPDTVLLHSGIKSGTAV